MPDRNKATYFFAKFDCIGADRNLSAFLFERPLLRSAASLPFFHSPPHFPSPLRFSTAEWLVRQGPSAFVRLKHAPLERGIHAVFHSPPGERVSFSCVAKRKAPKRRPPRHSRLTHSPCAPGARACSGVRRQSIHGLASNWPTSCGPSFGQFLRSLATIEGTQIACVVHAKAKIKGPSSACGTFSRVAGEGKARAKPKPKRAGICFVLAAQARAWMPEVEQRRSSCRMRSERAP